MRRTILLFVIFFIVVLMGSVVIAQVAQSDFAGSAACLGCHGIGVGPQISETDFLRSFHNKKLRNAATGDLIPALQPGGSSDWVTQSFILPSGISIDLSIVDNTTDTTFRVGIDGLDTYDVKYFLGGAGWKQRYITQIDSSIYILPLQYNKSTNEWVDYHNTDWGNGASTPAKTASYDRRCAGCHTTGTEVHYNATTEEYIATWKELNVGCEACHGAGGPSSHTNFGLSGKGGNPADLTNKDRALEVCGQCHSRGSSAVTLTGAPSSFGFPWGTSDMFGSMPFGGTLANYYNQSPGLWGTGESKQHHQQYNDFLLSEHYANTEEEINCFTCHDPHNMTTNTHQVRDSMVEESVTISTENDDDTLCLTCHAGSDDFAALTKLDIQDYGTNGSGASSFTAISAAVSEHTNHSFDPTNLNSTNGASRCSKCHMPKVAKSAIEYDIHNHSFATMTPQGTLEYAQPSGCAVSCHRSEDGDSYGTLFDGISDVSLADWSETTDSTLANELNFWDRNLFFEHRSTKKSSDLTFTAEFTTSDPTLDGDLSEWTGTWLDIPISNGNTVSVLAKVTTTDIYFAAKWADPTMSATRGAWKYDTVAKTWSTVSGQGEDRLGILWNINNSIPDFSEKGCLNKCHRDVDNNNTGNPNGDMVDDAYLETGRGDMWHMKSARSLGVTSANQEGILTIDPDTYEVTAGKIILDGFLDDKHVEDFDPNEEGGRIGDSGSSTYSSNKNTEGTAPLLIEKNPTDFIDAMVLTVTEVAAGEVDTVANLDDATLELYWNKYVALNAVVPERFIKDPTDSRGDVFQAAVWENGEWKTEIKRALHTGDTVDDVTFSGGADYQFGVALMDNSGGDQHYTTAGLVVTMSLPVITNVDDEDIVSGVPTKFRLNQNYPNPFNPVTTITYELPITETVSLRIYNVAGQLIRTLVNEQQPSGNHNAQWDGKDDFGQKVSSGIYIYALRAGTFTETRKMVLIK